jgi:hypothetical protein
VGAMTAVPNTYELERDVLPALRRSILNVEDLATRHALYSLLALVHDLAAELNRIREQ